MGVATPRDPAELYLELLKRALTRSIAPEAYAAVETTSRLARALRPVARALDRRGVRLVRGSRTDESARREGRDRPLDAETMIGLRRLDNLQDAIRDVVHDGVPGDLIECGVWRGGATIFMRGALEAYGDRERRVWVADSFRGLPKPDAARYPRDAGDRHWADATLSVSLDEVRDAFRRYGLLDERVRFLPGWFSETLPSAEIRSLALLRIDADMYGSTREALEHLYPKLSPGGFAIVDDYGAVAACRAAVDDFRREAGIREELRQIDWTGVYWRRRSES